MERDIIGAILRERIKECGYSQEEFAEQTGIGLSSLKKYMNGTNCYDVEALDRFAEALKCSYDYLLGKTATPEPQYRTIKDSTKLADGTIERLVDAAQNDDMMLVQVFDYLIQNDKLVDSAQNYISIQLHEIAHGDEPEDERYVMLNDNFMIENSMLLGEYTLRVPELSDVYLSGIMTAFRDNLDKFGMSLTQRRYYFRGQEMSRKQSE